ncbi:hypothetical protein L1D34_07165 [Vibrio mediterranei]|uniref:hypothetical protein n=1 Tax=Vibrio mediterranei TaxID=689 RepID=UPI001EFC79C6|nr:hypothetical protein [Vibrio mediterranei]MCG9624618.1 hypothetical protein [Vibrio mediterranei]
MNGLYDPYTVILIAIGVVMSLPWLAQISQLLGRKLVSYFHPITTITLEFEDEEGYITTRKIKLANSAELAQAILKARRIVEDE